jgi:isopenicillin-N epimerase
MLAPTGSGFLFLGKGSEDRLQPLQVSWGWRADRSKLDEADEFGSTPRLRCLEFEGTRDPCPWLAIPAAVDFQEHLGWQPIRERNEELVAYTRERLVHRNGLNPATPRHPKLHGFMTAFHLPAETDALSLRRGLLERRIEAPVIERLNRLLIRVSTHFYNTEIEIDHLSEALQELLP